MKKARIVLVANDGTRGFFRLNGAGVLEPVKLSPGDRKDMARAATDLILELARFANECESQTGRHVSVSVTVDPVITARGGK